jgi:formate dehydrogenase major subunit
VQGATDLGVLSAHPARLLRPVRRRLGALGRVWEEDLDWLKGRFATTTGPTARKNR